ncbi:MAG: hypothetical protein JNJ49_08115 [Bdellovibrionaceae bacterium]|nr:hypothetical protein [Pseudobdellovibrionaceae bacterium]
MRSEDALSGPVGTILFSGDDPKGLMREAAFRARLSIRTQIDETSERCLAAFVTLGDDIERWQTQMQRVRARHPDLPIVVLIERKTEVDGAALFAIAEKYRVQYWVDSQARELVPLFEKLVRLHDEFRSREKSRKELGLRNRQLRDLQANLEKIVTERTSYLADAERELHSRTQTTRELVRFIKELSQAETIEEILQLVSYEMRSFHEVRPPVLAVASQEFGARLYFQQARGAGGRPATRAVEKNWGSKIVRQMWSARSVIRTNDVDDQSYLAQEFGRPVARTVAFPLGNRGHTQVPVLIFEHGFDGEKVERFTRFWTARLEPLSMAIERVFLNREMFSSSRMWETIFDGIADPIAVLTDGHEPIRLNQAFSENAGRRCYEIFAGRSAPCDGCQMQKVLVDGVQAEWQIRRGERVFRVKSYPIRLSKLTLINHYTDISKGLELKGHAIQGEKMAAIGLMAGNIAHELNNPLTGLRSLAQVLSVDSRFPDSVRNDLKEIESAAERSSRIIRDLMEFSSAGDHVRALVSINDVVESSLNMIKTALHDHAVNADLLPANEGMIRVDPHLLQHVVFNILNNASQAMRGAGEIRIRTRLDGDWVETEIADTGPGIPDEILGRIFEPFFTTKAAGQGTGLGLSMSRWIIENFGGTIVAKNKADANGNKTGAMFIIRLPRARAE